MIRPRRYRRLYWQVYVAVILVGVFCILVAGLAVHLLHGGSRVPRPVEVIARLIAKDLPISPVETQAALEENGTELGLDLTLWTPDGQTPLATAGKTIPAPGLDGTPGWFKSDDGAGIHVRLKDGRWLSGRHVDASRRNGGKFLFLLVVLMVAVAIGCYPLARRLTRRVEALQRGVDGLGDGDLSARVPVDGRDEIAALAASFNRAAVKIEKLVEAQRRVLASASHELRSPLTRLRMALELLGETQDADARQIQVQHAARDIEELDQLIGDLLLSSRIGGSGVSIGGPVDLLSLLTEEGARVGAEVGGQPLLVPGDAQALRRLMRNLLQNAVRHSGSPDVEAWVEPLPIDQRGARIVVADRGPGIPPEVAERIFEPFYRKEGHSEGVDGGVGLGLALVREIARGHHGDVRYVPREGGGSQFEVDLPVISNVVL